MSSGTKLFFKFQMPTSGATVEQKNGVLELTKLEYHKKGTFLYISQTVFRAQIFRKLMLMGHFAHEKIKRDRENIPTHYYMGFPLFYKPLFWATIYI